MSDWEIITEEASIVLVGNMNPKIFHPEWLIRKGIVAEWDYSKNKDDVINLADLAQIGLPDDLKITVLLNQFSIRSSRASEYLSLQDMIINIFTLLAETPITKMGMNFSSVIKIENIDKWKKFGHELAPQQYWKNAIPFIETLDEEKQMELGLWELTMNLPRPDDFEGYIRPKIAVLPQAGQKTLSFNINNHIEITDSSAETMIGILEGHWNKSLVLAKELTKNIMESQLSE